MEVRSEKIFIDVVYTCDICSEKSRGWKCVFCKRDLCITHAIADSDEDYPNYYCQPCWLAGMEIRHKIEKEIARHDRAIEALQKEWKEKALAADLSKRNYGLFTENEPNSTGE